MKKICFVALAVIALSCTNKRSTTNDNSGESEAVIRTYETVGSIERLHPVMSDLFSENAKIEVLGEGFVWSEGPVWSKQLNGLLFSDVKENKIYKWTEEEGISLFLEPSGFTGDSTDSREKGSNGLSIDAYGHLVLCQHGDRRVARMLSTLDRPKAEFETVQSHYDNKRLNSPNDLTFDKKGNLYFTDPPYGLSEEMLNDPKKELDFQGVYRLSVDDSLKLLIRDLNYPNGVALSPDNKTLYVSNSEAGRALWMKYLILENGDVGEGQVFYNVTDLIGKEQGFPDGIEIDFRGYIYTAGPGGLWIFDPDGLVIGKLRVGGLVSNCAFDENEKMLYITADDYLLRVKLK